MKDEMEKICRMIEKLENVRKFLENIETMKERKVVYDENGNYLKDENGWIVYDIDNESSFNNFIDEVAQLIYSKYSK